MYHVVHIILGMILVVFGTAEPESNRQASSLR